MTSKTCWINVRKCNKNSRSARANHSTHQSKHVCKVYSVCGIRSVIQEKALFCYALVNQKSKRQITTYEILDTLKYNNIPYDILTR